LTFLFSFIILYKINREKNKKEKKRKVVPLVKTSKCGNCGNRKVNKTEFFIHPFDSILAQSMTMFNC
jgi:hypothetical protein